jgi:chitin synthase
VRLCLNQILRLSAHSKKEIKIADQIKAFHTLLDSFGNAKTLLNPNASRHGRYLEMHFNERGRISAAKVLTFGLDKSRLGRLSQEERSYHVFYQFLAGATPAERDTYYLEDPSDYGLLASSGCYRLPGGPFSDDSIAMDELRAAMKTLGVKPKHVSSIFALLAAILLLGNIQFGEGDARDVSAYVVNAPVLDQVARLLGVAPDDLGQTLTNKTSYVKKELYTVLLNAEQSAAQRNQFVADIYAILFSFVVETANHRLAPPTKDPSPHQQIVFFDLPGFQSRGPAGTNSMALTGTAPLISAYGHSGFEEFCTNFGEELLHSYVLRNTFEDSMGYNSQATSDGVSLPAISTMDNLGCIELLRGSSLSERGSRKPGGMLGVISKACAAYKSGKGGERRNEDLLQDLNVRFGVHASYVASAESGHQSLFGINHYAGNCSYDIRHFLEKDTDMLDSAFVTLMRGSSDSFVSKLFSGPSMAVERHSKDDTMIVQAQVSSRPLRQPTPIMSPNGSQQIADDHPQLDISKVYPVTTQLNFTLSEIFASLDSARLWTISCIRPNDSGSPNSFDKRRVKAQIRSLLLPDIIARRSSEYIVDFDQGQFCDRYVPTMRGSEAERIRQCAAANGWRQGQDYVVGHRMIWLTFSAWKMVEDVLRATEKEQKKTSLEGEEDDEAALPDDTTEYTHTELATQGGYFNESVDNLLLTRTGTDGAHYLDPNSAGTPYGGGGARSQSAQGFSESGEGGWGSDYDKKPSPGNSPLVASKEAAGMIINPAPHAVEEVPSSGTRRVWLWLVWMVTGFIPTLFLSSIGRMKRPDIRIAWREKVTIFFLIFLLNCAIIFYIVEFGRLLCPNFDKAWSVEEVGLHTGENDFWVAIQGSVYDISSFINGDHSDISGVPSNGANTLEFVAGQDLTYYFPPPLVLACQNLVTDPQLALVYKNFTVLVPTAVHTSGAMQTTPNTKLDNPSWYTQVFQPSIQQFYKGPLVWKRSDVLSQALDANSSR